VLFLILNAASLFSCSFLFVKFSKIQNVLSFW